VRVQVFDGVGLWWVWVICFPYCLCMCTFGAKSLRSSVLVVVVGREYRRAGRGRAHEREKD
jgi:hypothetical protein